MTDAAASPAVETSITHSDVVTKYTVAADITNRTLTTLIPLCIPGANILNLCKLGDKLILDGTNAVYTKSKMIKGIAFPTSISVNHVACHFSPLVSDEESKMALNKDDVVKMYFFAFCMSSLLILTLWIVIWVRM